MKHTFLLFGFLFSVIITTTAQSGKKQPKQKEKPSMQKELEEIQKEMEDLSPEEKQMMEKMGIKGTLENMKKMDSKEMQEAWENADLTVPKKDAARIAAIPAKPLTEGTMAAYLSSINNKIGAALKPIAKSTAEKIYADLKTKNTRVMGNTAAGLWMMGRNQTAIYLMGLICADNPGNTDNINNYAAMLSMNAGEHLALPLLNYLNTKFPKNSTILNNIGQAWFGLGDIAKASKYLDSTIRIAAYHPQANFTKCFIETSEGNTAGAIEAAKKSIKKGFSTEKESQLKKLGYKLKGDDISWHEKMPADALGLEKFVRPGYPKNVKESDALKKTWKDFTDLLSQEKEKLEEKLSRIEPEVEKQKEKRMQEMMKAAQSGTPFLPFPSLAIKAFVKLDYLISDKDGSKTLAQKRQNEKLLGLAEEIDKFEEKLSQQLRDIENKYKDLFGEGKENPFADRCRDENTARNAYLAGVNTLLEEQYQSYLEFLRKKSNNETYYYQYTQWPDEFEVTKLQAKIGWLGALSSAVPKFQSPSGYCQNLKEEKPKSNKLAEFDDVACKYHSELGFGENFQINLDCSRLTTKIETKILKLGLKQNIDMIGFGDQFINATVEIRAHVEVGEKVGPIGVSAGVGAGVGVEIDRTGITDAYIVGEAGVSAGVGVVTIDMGVEGRMSFVSGKGTVDGTGIFKNVK